MHRLFLYNYIGRKLSGSFIRATFLFRHYFRTISAPRYVKRRYYTRRIRPTTTDLVREIYCTRSRIYRASRKGRPVSTTRVHRAKISVQRRLGTTGLHFPARMRPISATTSVLYARLLCGNTMVTTKIRLRTSSVLTQFTTCGNVGKGPNVIRCPTLLYRLIRPTLFFFGVPRGRGLRGNFLFLRGTSSFEVLSPLTADYYGQTDSYFGVYAPSTMD